MFNMQHYDITKCCNAVLINDREGVGSCVANELNGHPSLLFSVNLSLKFLHHSPGGHSDIFACSFAVFIYPKLSCSLIFSFIFSYYNLLCHFL